MLSRGVLESYNTMREQEGRYKSASQPFSPQFKRDTHVLVNRMMDEIARVLAPNGLYIADEFAFNEDIAMSAIGQFAAMSKDDFCIMRRIS